MKAHIVEIKRLAIHDGDGIRTTVFFKGCPMKCVWCHNPESIDFCPQVAYYEDKCIGCGECVKMCPMNAHMVNESGHLFDRKKCIACGKCAGVCLGNALAFYGKEISVEELIPILLEDKGFYDNSNGGITLSGGECLMYADFCADLLKKCKEYDLHTAVDTCGYVSKKAIEKVMPYTDVFLYDVKAFDEEVHIKCTGRSNNVILENLKYIDDCGKTIEIRIPFVPGMNDNQIAKIAEFLSELKNIAKVRILPYHNYAGSKYRALSMKNTLPNTIPTKEEIESAEKCLMKYGLNV